MRPFTLRHEKTLASGKIRVQLDERLRNRLYATAKNHNHETRYFSPDNPGYPQTSNSMADAEARYAEFLGIVTYHESDYGIRRESIDSLALFKTGKPAAIFDYIEIMFECMSNDYRPAFQKDINDSLTAFSCPWRLSDGMFFKVDLVFLEEEIIQHSTDLLNLAFFAGAHDEFQAARNSIMSEDFRNAISLASASVESTLKAILQVNHGTTHRLLEDFVSQGFMDDIPIDKAKVVRRSLESLSLVRNELGAHGQGKEKLAIPKAYADLCLRLAGSINAFLLDQYLRKNPVSVKPSDKKYIQGDLLRFDDIPF